MIRSWRLFVLTAAALVTLGVGAASAQTVYVSRALPGAPVEVLLNGTAIGSVKTDNAGVASVPVDLMSLRKRSEIGAHVIVDVCGPQYRVLVQEPGEEPPFKLPACERHDVAGVFVFRQGTSLVVDVWKGVPTVWLRQGPPPSGWLTTPSASSEDEETLAPRFTRYAPKGVVIFGGSGLGQYSSDVLSTACGSATCNGGTWRPAFQVGGALWLTRWLGIQASYIKPNELTTTGSGTPYTFASNLESRMVSITGNIGPSLGPVRLYLMGGAVFQRSKVTTTQTNSDKAIAQSDGSTLTIPGGTFTMKLPTQGWSWTVGGGMEAWVSGRIALYTELGFLKLKGAPETGEGRFDNRMLYATAGIRLAMKRR